MCVQKGSQNRISLVVKVLVLNLNLFPDKPCLAPELRTKLSSVYASRREASEEEAMSFSGHRLVPPKKSGRRDEQLELKLNES